MKWKKKIRKKKDVTSSPQNIYFKVWIDIF